MLIYVQIRLNRLTDKVASIRKETTASEKVYVGEWSRDTDSDSDWSSSDEHSHNDMETDEEMGINSKWHNNC